MRWDRFFDDLEDQLASEWEAERAALDTEAERLRLSRVTLRERLVALMGEPEGEPRAVFEFADGAILRARVDGVGLDWMAIAPDDGSRGGLLVPLASVVTVGMPHTAVMRTVRPAQRRASLSDRLAFGFVLRDLVRRRTGVTIGLVQGRVLTGTMDLAGADHLDIALHDRGAARRNDTITGYRVIPFGAVAWVRLDDPSTS